MVFNIRLSDRQKGFYCANGLLLGVVLLAWTYTILAGKFVSERYLKNIDLSKFYPEEYNQQTEGG